MGILKRIVLHLLCAGFLAAGVAATTDPFFAQWCFIMAAGAFALAWMMPEGDRSD